MTLLPLLGYNSRNQQDMLLIILSLLVVGEAVILAAGEVVLAVCYMGQHHLYLLEQLTQLLLVQAVRVQLVQHLREHLVVILVLLVFQQQLVVVVVVVL
jgi:hypothetical protein